MSLCVSGAPGPRPRPRPGVPERKGQDALVRFLGDLSPHCVWVFCAGGHISLRGWCWPQWWGPRRDPSRSHY